MRPDDERAVSTVLDATLCLLLITAAVGVLVAAPSDRGAERDQGAERSAAATTDVLTTSTARVEYSVDPTSDDVAPTYPSSDGAYRRSAHGTLAELLAAAAVAAGRVEETSIVPHDAFESAVRTATAARIADVADDARVIARWEPYPNAPVEGSVAVGPTPPPDADVEAAAATVSTPGRCPERSTTRTSRRGFDGVAQRLATCVVRTWFPPDATRVALRGQPPAPELVTHRYRRATGALGVSVRAPTSPRHVDAANDLLGTGLTELLADDLRERYETPGRATLDASVGQVVITVRTW